MFIESISVAEAAIRLELNQSRIRAMIAVGMLDAVKIGGRWLISSDSIDRIRDSNRPVGRPFSLTKAWGLLLVANGDRPNWLSPWDLSRIRRRLREQGLVTLAPRLRSRAVLHRLRSHPSDTKRIMADKNIVSTGTSAAFHYDLDIMVSDQSDIYVPDIYLNRFKKKYSLQLSQRPNLLVRVVKQIWPFKKNHPFAPAPVVGVDLIESDESRTRRAGEQLLEQVEVQWLT